MLVIQFIANKEEEKENVKIFFFCSLTSNFFLLLLFLPKLLSIPWFYFIILSTLLVSLTIMTVSVEKRQLIVNQHKKGKSPKEIADNMEVELRTVERILKQYRETGDITPKTCTGRHRLLTPRDERELVLTMRRQPNLKPSTLRHSLTKKVSPQTITRTLNRAGLHPYKMRRKPRLTAAQRHARVEWAKKYAQKPPNFWDSVIFSDESSFHTHEAVKGRYVWRFAGEELVPKMVQPVTKFGGHKLQVWGCITSRGVGYPCSLPEGIDGPTYLTVLEDELVKTIKEYFRDFKGVVFQQDGAGPHRAKVVNSYFRKRKYSVLPGPPIPPTFLPSRTSGPTSRSDWRRTMGKSRRPSSGGWWKTSGTPRPQTSAKSCSPPCRRDWLPWSRQRGDILGTDASSISSWIFLSSGV